MQLTLTDGVIAYDYQVVSGGRRPVLFLHGALGVRGQLAGLANRFADRSHIVLDFAAHGESTSTGGSMHCERLASDVLALLDALELEQVDIVGHSMGGYVGLVLAHLAPGRIGSVVTYGTKFYWDGDTIRKTASELDAQVMRTRSARYYEALAALHTTGGADRALAFAQSLITDFARWRLTDDMIRECNVPLLISAGDRDVMVPVNEVMQLFRALDPKSNAVAVVPGAPHPLQQLPLECFEHIVRRFWAFAGAT